MPIPAEPTLAPQHSPHGEQDSAVLTPEVDHKEEQTSEVGSEVTQAPSIEPVTSSPPVAAAPTDVAPMVAAPPALAPMEGNPVTDEEPGMAAEPDAPAQEFTASEGTTPPSGSDGADNPPSDSGGAGGSNGASGGSGDNNGSTDTLAPEETKEDETKDPDSEPAADPDAPTPPRHTTPRSPEEDPAFQATVARKDKTVEEQQAHQEPTVAAGAAQASSVSPSNERESLAEAGQVNEMEQEEPGVFDAASFKAMLMEAIKAILPKNNDEADKFADSGKVDEVKNKATSQVESQKENAAGSIEQKTQEAPDISSIPVRKVQPLTPQDPGPAPADIEASKAMPPKRGDAEVNAPLDQNVAEVDQKMADAEVTDEQLANSNEPAFTGALASKKEAKQHAKEAPVLFRQQEQETLTQSEANAQAAGEAQLTAMHQDRTGVMGQVSAGQRQTATKDTSARQKVADHINGLYEQTKTEVESILSNLDTSVKTMFDTASARATKAFENHVDKRMSAYKRKRYSGLIGKGRWLKDLFAGLPDEVNAFFTEGRNLYLNIMDGELTTIAEHVAKELTAAKDRIQKGKQDIQDYVISLPKNLQQVGKNAADAINSKFDELTESVNSKGEELVDTIADMYKESLDKVDARIEEMKAANRGLIDMALGALIGVIETILKIKNLLFELLVAALEVIGTIITDPIGFLSNLIEGVKLGINNFITNILSNVMTGLIEWLTGSLGNVGIQMPDNLFSLSGIFSLVTQMLGLTWDYFRSMAVKMLGEPVVEAMEKGLELFQIIRKDGVEGLWEYIKEQFTDLKEMVMDAIRDMIVTKVIEAGIKWILGLLSPAGAFIKAAMLIIDIVKFFVERAAQIFELVQAFIEGIKAVASGNVNAVAKAIEKALVKAIPILIGFLAALVGVTGLTSKVQKIIKKVRKRIDKAIRKIIKKAKKAFRKLVRKGKKKVKGAVNKLFNWWKFKKPIKSKDGSKHSIYYKGKGKSAELVVESTPRTIAQILKDTGAKSKNQKQEQAYQGLKTINPQIVRHEAALENNRLKDNEKQREYDQLQKKINSATTYISELLPLVENADVPKAIMPAFSNNVLAHSFQAMYITNDQPGQTPKGQDAGVNKGRTLKGWRQLQSFIVENGKRVKNDKGEWINVDASVRELGNYVKMHLLHDGLGGKATDSNLVPAKSEINNQFYSRLEKFAVQDIDGPDPKVLWFNVKVDFYPSSPDEDAIESIDYSGYPSEVNASYGHLTYDAASKKWIKGPALKTFRKNKIDIPDFGTAKDRKFNLNMGFRTFMAMEDTDNFPDYAISFQMARAIYDGKRRTTAKKYANFEEFKAVMITHHKKSRGLQKGAGRPPKVIPDFYKAMTVIANLNKRGRIEFK